MKLKLMIIEAGMTQREVCKKLGWYEEKLSRLIRGKAWPTEADIKALSECLGKTEKEISECFFGRQT